MATGLFAEFYRIVRAIPRGKVASYGQVARLAGHPRSARFVGFALHANPDPVAVGGAVPCHRVVFKDGGTCTGFAFGGPEAQRRLLEEEGVRFRPDGRIDMAACQWEVADAEEFDLLEAQRML